MSYLPLDGIDAGLNYLGTWDADTNTPALTSGVGEQGDYYIVGVAGTTTLDGISEWGVGDWVIFNGTAWQKIDNSDRFLTVTFRPGYSGPDSNIFTDWTALMAFVATQDTPMIVSFDDRDGAITIPAGTHTFPLGSHWKGIFELPFTEVTIADGCVLEGVNVFEEGLSIVNLSTAPVVVFDDGAQHIITFQRGCNIVCPSTGPFVQSDGAGTLVVAALYGAEPIANVSNTPIFNAINSSFMVINPVVISPIPENILGADAASVVQVFVFGDTDFNSTQINIVGGLIITYADIASRISFDPVAAGWPATVDTVQAAIDLLATQGYSEDLTYRGTTGISLLNAHSFTTPVLPAGTYDIEVDYRWAYDATNTDFLAQVNLDGGALFADSGGSLQHAQEPKDAGGAGTGGTNQRHTARITRRVTFGADAAHTIDLFIASLAGGVTASIYSSMIRYRRVA